jgi:hypothetical protein
MKRKITAAFAGLAVAAGSLVLSALPALGANSGTVNAKVTVSAPCLTIDWVSGTGLDFGTLAFGDALGRVGYFKVTNCAPGAENVSARGTDAASATSTASWSLLGSAPACPSTGANKYALSTFLPQGATPITFLTSADKPFATGLAPGSYDAGVSIHMPCSGSAGAGETMNFQVIYTASQ